MSYINQTVDWSWQESFFLPWLVSLQTASPPAPRPSFLRCMQRNRGVTRGLRELTVL